MNIAAQPLTTEAPELSPWWLRTVLIVMLLGFAGLLAITSLAYRNAPPIPAKILDAQGVRLFSGDEIKEGQAIFLKYGLMNNGSIWGTAHTWGRIIRPRHCTASARIGYSCCVRPAPIRAGSTSRNT